MSIIRDPQYLDENYIPEKMWFRNEHLKVVAKAIEPKLSNSRHKNVLIHGASGSGKTSSSKYLLHDLKRHEPQIRAVYIDCWKHWTRFSLLKTIAEELGLKLIQGKIASNELLFKIENFANRHQCVLVLDEIDQLKDRWILYFFRDFNIAVILIAANESLIFHLDDKLRSRLEPLERVHFPTYKSNEIQSIVEIRAHNALQPGAIKRDQIKRIALNSGGNAHMALESLRIAVSRADEEDSSKIESDHLDYALHRANSQVKKKSLARLNEHQRLLYSIIKKQGNIKAGLLHEKYQEVATEPMSKRAVRNYLSKLAFYGFIRKHGANKDRTYSLNK